MNREECESLIARKILEIRDIANEYDNGCEYVSMSFREDDCGTIVMFNNQHWEDETNKISYFNIFNTEGK